MRLRTLRQRERVVQHRTSRLAVDLAPGLELELEPVLEPACKHIAIL